MLIFELISLSTCLFLFGLIGFLESRGFVSLLISTEVIMLGTNFNLLTCSLVYGVISGQVYALYILAVTAAETATGLGSLIPLYRSTGSLPLMILKF